MIQLLCVAIWSPVLGSYVLWIGHSKLLCKLEKKGSKSAAPGRPRRFRTYHSLNWVIKGVLLLWTNFSARLLRSRFGHITSPLIYFLLNEGNWGPYLIRLLWKLNAIIHVKRLLQCWPVLNTLKCLLSSSVLLSLLLPSLLLSRAPLSGQFNCQQPFSLLLVLLQPPSLVHPSLRWPVSAMECPDSFDLFSRCIWST